MKSKLKTISINVFSLTIGLTTLNASGILFDSGHKYLGLATFICAFYAIMFDPKKGKK